MPPEPEPLEPVADHGEWAKARVVVRRAARPTVEDHRAGCRPTYHADTGGVAEHRHPSPRLGHI
jgi:hypothetical protein